MSARLDAMSVEMPKVEKHPNRREFRGVLTLVGAPSDRAPSGAKGHRVILEARAAEKALPTLIGMALDYAPQWDRHDARRKIGIITSAELNSAPCKRMVSASVANPSSVKKVRAQAAGASIQLNAPAGGHQLEVQGYLFAHDFPEIVAEIQAGVGKLGMSYEIADVHVLDTKAPIWLATEFTFTGAAVLRRDKAAYASTWVELA